MFAGLPFMDGSVTSTSPTGSYQSDLKGRNLRPRGKKHANGAAVKKERVSSGHDDSESEQDEMEDEPLRGLGLTQVQDGL